MKLFAYLGALVFSANAALADVTVFAAASLKEPLDKIAVNHGNVTVSYGGSGTLARQVSLGAPADVVILANAEWVDLLAEQGHVTQAVDILSNQLVIVSGTAQEVALTPSDLQDALGDGRMAMGFTSSVPAGIYGKAALEDLDLWDTVANQIAEVDNVRAALALVARGEAPLGIVYATDARVVPDLYVAAVFPAENHPPIRYVAARVSDTPEAIAFMDRLQAADALEVFLAAGFLEVPQ